MIAMKLLRDPWVLLMLAVDFLLLGVLLSSLVHPLRAVVPTAHRIDLPAGATAAFPENNQATGSLADHYGQLIGQPIFQQDRKYTPPPKVDDTVAQTPPPDFSVTGFLAIPGRPGKAFLRERTGSRTLTVVVGDNVDGWTVAAATARQVNLRQSERSVDLVRGGAPVIVTSSGSSGPAATGLVAPAAMPASDIGPSPSDTNRQAVPQAVTTAGQSSSVALPPTQPRASVTAPPAAAASPISPVTITTTLQGVFVTAQKLQPFTPEDMGPPVLVSPRGPLPTYKLPAAPDVN
jgi:hypothetical protein